MSKIKSKSKTRTIKLYDGNNYVVKEVPHLAPDIIISKGVYYTLDLDGFTGELYYTIAEPPYTIEE